MPSLALLSTALVAPRRWPANASLLRGSLLCKWHEGESEDLVRTSSTIFSLGFSRLSSSGVLSPDRYQPSLMYFITKNGAGTIYTGCSSRSLAFSAISFTYLPKTSLLLASHFPRIPLPLTICGAGRSMPTAHSGSRLFVLS